MLSSPFDRHELVRSDVKQVICSVCNTEQPVVRVCTNCGVNMGEYFYEVCKFYDDDVVDVGSSELVHTFTPCRREHDEQLPPSEPPITKMFISSDGQWVAAINCFGDIYVFNLEIQRQHWFISRLDGASVAAGGFTPRNSNVLIISTSSNQVYAFDVEAKQLGEWSIRHTFVLPRRYQEFPGEVIGLSFPPSSN